MPGSERKSIDTMLNLGRSVFTKLVRSVFVNSHNGAGIVRRLEQKSYYNDLRYLVAYVNTQIQAGKKIDNECVMNPIRDRYDTYDYLDTINHLSHHLQLRGSKLARMTDDFLANMISYGSSFYLKNKRREKKAECQAISDRLSENILKRIGSVMTDQY